MPKREKDPNSEVTAALARMTGTKPLRALCGRRTIDPIANRVSARGMLTGFPDLPTDDEMIVGFGWIFKFQD